MSCCVGFFGVFLVLFFFFGGGGGGCVCVLENKMLILQVPQVTV